MIPITGFLQVPELSPLSKISLLTSGPGDILYTAFGHSAIRVQDPTLGIDVVYNYGVFDTRGENFYLKFSQGRMDYLLVREGFESYLRDYKLTNRWVTEQALNLSLPEKTKLFKYLENNNLPENKTYAYDYFSNNCATKIWFVLEENFGDKLLFDPNYIDQRYSFRELVHQHIKKNSWGAFGIDLALGADIDRKATPKEHLYLPIYVMRQFEMAKLNGTDLAEEAKPLFEASPEKNRFNFFTSPLFLSLIFSIIILGITYSDFKKAKRSRALDFSIFLITGQAGSLIFFLWFLTDHIWTVQNYNILWAFPLNLILSFLVLRKKSNPKIKNYFLILLGLLGLMLCFWVFGVQEFSPVLIPIMIALAARYLYLWKFYTSAKKIAS
ncbi:DUF4105 domain-containing protein [Maribacter halichondriae]|uniref:lipoprotein N-acyltransferase Lnb domain-containing protein n=1 Tax=Maribacter halichondriae TaxID=2980554 RepID=UPI002358AA46|nr:DUF4105 domain-containing protein [Maribacter sp. Hal144]